MEVHIQQATIIDPQSGYHQKTVNITINNGTVSKIEIIEDNQAQNSISAITKHGNTVWSNEITKEKLYISTGWVDVFADYCEPGFEHKETISSGLNAAAAGGFTDVFILPNTHPEVSTKSIVQFILQKAAQHIVTVHPLGSVTQNISGKDLAEMLDMHHSGAIAFTDGWKTIQNPGLLLKALEYVRAFDGIILQLPAEQALSAGGLMHEGIISTQLGMPGIPAIAESLMVHRDIELLRYTGSKLHLTGITTADSVNMIRKAKQDGLCITCSVTPYHLAFTDEQLTTYNSAYKVMPPLRTEEDRIALVHGLADGTIDCIASHHRPQDWDAKMKEFEYAADGMAIQEITFQVIWEAVKAHVPLDRLVEAISIIPRDIFSLHTGKINLGYNGNLTIFTTDSNFTFTKAMKQSAAFNNPFTGKSFSSRVLGIVNKGKTHLNF